MCKKTASLNFFALRIYAKIKFSHSGFMVLCENKIFALRIYVQKNRFA